MRKHKTLTLLALLGMLLIPIFAYSSTGLILPTGGRIIKSGASAEIVCAAQYGPLFIRPVNIAPLGPFFVRTGKMFPRIGGLILGNYIAIPDIGTCYNPATGVPIPAFEFRPYGVSR